MQPLRAALRALVEDVCQTCAGVTPSTYSWTCLVRLADGSARMHTEERADFLTPLVGRVEQLPAFDDLLDALQADPALSARFLVDAAGQPLADRADQRFFVLTFFAMPFLGRYLRRVQGFRFEATAFDALFGQVAADIASPTIVVTYLTPLLNVLLVPGAVELRPGLRLRQLATEEVEQWLNLHGEGTGLSSYQLMQLRCALEIDVARGRFDPSGAADTDGVRADAVNLLRLLLDRNVGLAFTQEVTPSISALGLTLFTQPALHLPDALATLDAATGERLARLWGRLQGTPRFALAFRRWGEALGRLREEDRLIDYWVGLETLFTPDGTTELRFRAALRVAALLGRTADEREAIYRDLGTSYNRRSGVVHGSDKSPADLPHVVGTTRAYLRRALLLILEAERPFDATALEILVLRESAPDAPGAR